MKFWLRGWVKISSKSPRFERSDAGCLLLFFCNLPASVVLSAHYLQFSVEVLRFPSGLGSFLSTAVWLFRRIFEHLLQLVCRVFVLFLPRLRIGGLFFFKKTHTQVTFVCISFRFYLQRHFCSKSALSLPGMRRQ